MEPPEGSRGRPRRRSPIWLRTISEVPPAMVRQRAKISVACTPASGPSASAPAGPMIRSASAAALLRVLRRSAAWPRCPRDRARRRDRAFGGAQVEQTHAAALRRAAARRVRARTVSSSAWRCARSSRSNIGSPMPPPPPPMLTRSLPSVERATRHPPFDRADDVLVGDEHVVEEHLVEQRMAGRLAQRTDVDAGRVQVDHQTP